VSSVRTKSVRLFGRCTVETATDKSTKLLACVPPEELCANTVIPACSISGAFALALIVSVSGVLGGAGFGVKFAITPDGRLLAEKSKEKFDAEELVVNCVDVVPPCPTAKGEAIRPMLKLGPGDDGLDCPPPQPINKMSAKAAARFFNDPSSFACSSASGCFLFAGWESAEKSGKMSHRRFAGFHFGSWEWMSWRELAGKLNGVQGGLAKRLLHVQRRSNGFQHIDGQS
jgi:hypothetical protein